MRNKKTSEDFFFLSYLLHRCWRAPLPRSQYKTSSGSEETVDKNQHSLCILTGTDQSRPFCSRSPHHSQQIHTFEGSAMRCIYSMCFCLLFFFFFAKSHNKYLLLSAPWPINRWWPDSWPCGTFTWLTSSQRFTLLRFFWCLINILLEYYRTDRQNIKYKLFFFHSNVIYVA